MAEEKFTDSAVALSLSSDSGSLPFQSPTSSTLSTSESITSSVCPCGFNVQETRSCDLHSVHAPETEEHPVTLCIKLPSCNRIEHKFDYKRDRIKDVVSFVHCFITGEKDTNLGADDVCLNDNSVPINVYSDHFLTLYEAGLTHNTLLHFSYT